jgi:hypothetical protein
LDVCLGGTVFFFTVGALQLFVSSACLITIIFKHES